MRGGKMQTFVRRNLRKHTTRWSLEVRNIKGRRLKQTLRLAANECNLNTRKSFALDSQKFAAVRIIIRTREV